MAAGRTRVRRVLVLVGIVGVHGVLVVGLATVVNVRLPWADAQEPLRVRWVVPPPPEPTPTVQRRPARVDAPGRRVRSAAAAPPVSAPSAAPAPAAPVGRVDWSSEAARVADEAARAPGAVPQCEPTGRPDAKLPPCPARGKRFEWRREPRAVEFSGGLPYVRLGKRCAVGLGFFGCGIGKLPEANGALFDGMHDADRERSSVPEVPR